MMFSVQERGPNRKECIILLLLCTAHPIQTLLTTEPLNSQSLHPLCTTTLQQSLIQKQIFTSQPVIFFLFV